MTFQVKLFPTSNAIEFHYCCMLMAGASSTAYHSGAEATVGLENATGTQAYLYPHNVPDALTTSNAPRFTTDP